MSKLPIGPERVSRFRPVPIEQVVLLPLRPLLAWILVGKLAVVGDKGGRRGPSPGRKRKRRPLSFWHAPAARQLTESPSQGGKF